MFEVRYGVVVFDYIKPSQHNNRWGLSGTCVNVGCIPKKLYHLRAKRLEELRNNFKFGVNNQDINNDFSFFQKNVQSHIKSLNFKYNKGLLENNIEYINKLARFKSENSIEFGTLDEITNNNNLKSIEFNKAIICVGGRPLVPSNLKGSKHCITSDDIFFLTDIQKKNTYYWSWLYWIRNSLFF